MNDVEKLEAEFQAGYEKGCKGNQFRIDELEKKKEFWAERFNGVTETLRLERIGFERYRELQKTVNVKKIWREELKTKSARIERLEKVIRDYVECGTDDFESDRKDCEKKFISMQEALKLKEKT